ncbi:YopX family protein [Enterococcus mundtii]|uniref:YopX family protein n=1 Tax=Enterococcus mundtii TaxID=53346 RepID=UPI000E062DAB|nr:YopX family protein [Enterococcus mundtii]MDB7086961.1 YopX family protein [Enterococcus mundtii]STD25027.1 YopX protein [Enterococcus mundtii]
MIPNFRAWDKETQSLRDVLVIDWLNELVDLEGGRIDRQFDEVELMQFTGLKDKNGVEIFEGDIVAVENHPFQRKENSGVGMEIEGDYVVGWNQHDLTWCVGDLLLARLKPYVRVIGNIYENPELLEVK